MFNNYRNYYFQKIYSRIYKIVKVLREQYPTFSSEADINKIILI
jgi:hypothetical protein